MFILNGGTSQYDNVSRLLILLIHDQSWEAIRIWLYNGTWICKCLLCMFSLGCHGNRWLNFLNMYFCNLIRYPFYQLPIFSVKTNFNIYRTSAHCVIFLWKFMNQLIYLESILPVQSFIIEKPVINLMLSVEHKKMESSEVNH